MDSSTPIQNEDLYKLLNVAEDASEKEITKAYRAAALKVHPDKNPDDPQAAHKFRRLSEALQLLTDAAARAAYDRVRRARLAAAERARALGEGRRRFKEQLEAAEAAASSAGAGVRRAEDEARLEREMQRLRRDWGDVLAREQERMRREMRETAAASAATAAPAADEAPTLKVTWRGAGDGGENAGGAAAAATHTEESLRALCSAYGEVASLLLRPGKRRLGGGVALVEFRRRDAARRMVEASATLPGGLSAVWVQGERPAAAPAAASAAPARAASSESLRRMESDILARMMSAGSKRPCPAASDTTAGPLAE